MRDLKKEVQAVITERQLASIMNNTKWNELQKAVRHSLPFTPPIKLNICWQIILNQRILKIMYGIGGIGMSHYFPISVSNGLE